VLFNEKEPAVLPKPYNAPRRRPSKVAEVTFTELETREVPAIWSKSNEPVGFCGMPKAANGPWRML
jgi:hypothetical protein